MQIRFLKCRLHIPQFYELFSMGFKIIKIKPRNTGFFLFGRGARKYLGFELKD